MQNKQNTTYKTDLENEYSRTFQRTQIKFTYRLVHLETQWTTTKSKKSLKHLKKIFNRVLPPTNPFRYWVNRQLSINTDGMNYHTIRYDNDKGIPQEII